MNKLYEQITGLLTQLPDDMLPSLLMATVKESAHRVDTKQGLANALNLLGAAVLVFLLTVAYKEAVALEENADEMYNCMKEVFFHRAYPYVEETMYEENKGAI